MSKVSQDNLIAQLGHCGSEAEVKQVLNGYQELITPELLEVMARKAEGLRDNHDWDGANLLLSLALQVGEVLGSSETQATLRNETAGVLSKMGKREYEISRFSEAIQFYKLSLTIYREFQNYQGEVDALCGLGSSYRRLDDKERATAIFQESLAMAREIEYGQGEVDGLNGLGAIDNSLGKYELAKAYHQEALTIAEAIGYPKGRAFAFNGLGNVCRGLGEYEEAIAYHQKCLAIDQDIKDRFWECVSFYNLAQNYQSLKQYE